MTPDDFPSSKLLLVEREAELIKVHAIVDVLNEHIKADNKTIRHLRRHLRTLTKQVTITINYLDSLAVNLDWRGCRDATATAVNALDIANDTARRDGLGENLTLRRLRRGAAGADRDKAVVVDETGKKA